MGSVVWEAMKQFINDGQEWSEKYGRKIKYVMTGYTGMYLGQVSEEQFMNTLAELGYDVGQNNKNRKPLPDLQRAYQII
jgi:hypothetical protein